MAAAATVEQAPGPASDQDIAAAQSALGLQFPPDYLLFLKRFNGGYPQPDRFAIQWRADQALADDWKTSTMSWFYAIGSAVSSTDLVPVNTVDFRDRLPRGTFAFASDAGGNQLLLALAGPFAGKVLFWCKDHEVGEGGVPGYDNVGIVADSFQDLLDHRLR